MEISLSVGKREVGSDGVGFEQRHARRSAYAVRPILANRGGMRLAVCFTLPGRKLLQFSADSSRHRRMQRLWIWPRGEATPLFEELECRKF